jgi:hypothetical protein
VGAALRCSVGDSRVGGENRDVTKYVAIGWFPAGELERARALWPNLLADWDVSTHQEYCHEVDRHLRQLEFGTDTQVLLAPIEVKYFLKWCAREGLDSAAAESRSKYATTIATRGRVQVWPPERGKQCWCGRDRDYEVCCGA